MKIRKRGLARRAAKSLVGSKNNKKRATYESPFALVLGIEAVLPTEAELPTITTMVAENIEENQRQLARKATEILVGSKKKPKKERQMNLLSLWYSE